MHFSDIDSEIIQNLHQYIVTKRKGNNERFNAYKIYYRIQMANENIDNIGLFFNEFSKHISSGILYSSTIDEFLAISATNLSQYDSKYASVASFIVATMIHKNTKSDFAETMCLIYNSNVINGIHRPLISTTFMDCVRDNWHEFQSLDHKKDYTYPYNVLRMFMENFLIRLNGKVIERPQHFFMRVALSIFDAEMEAAKNCYRFLSDNIFTFSLPVLFSAGKSGQQNQSCFSTSVRTGVDDIYNHFLNCYNIVKYGGHVNIDMNFLRSSDNPSLRSPIEDVLKEIDHEAVINNFDHKRSKGSITIHLEVWHSDVYVDFKTKYMSYSISIPDLFMERVEADANWSLMCPEECPGLNNCWGDNFRRLYERYEAQNRVRRTLKARELWQYILNLQIKTGQPSIVYKDAFNRLSPFVSRKLINAGCVNGGVVMINKYNLYSSCTTGTLNLKKMSDNGSISLKSLYEATKMLTYSLDRIVNSNKTENLMDLQHLHNYRAIGINVQGLADLFINLKLPYDSPDAEMCNRLIFETIHYAAMEASCELARHYGRCKKFEESKLNQNIILLDMWKYSQKCLYDWKLLKRKIHRYGIRNAILIALADTDPRMNILNANRSVDPLVSNINAYRNLVTEYKLFDENLYKYLSQYNILNSETSTQILNDNGSVQNILQLPQEVRELFKTAWEIPPEKVIDLAAGRAPFVDQGQAINVYLTDPTPERLSEVHFYAWNKQIKNGMHRLYTRYTRPTPQI